MIDGTPEEPVPKQYFLSPTYRYDLMFFSDSGPGYGGDMEWPCATLDALGDSAAAVAIIDHRLSSEEVRALAATVPAMPQRLFVFTIVDPFTQHNEDGPYRELLLALAGASNVVFLSKYQPAEFTARLHDAAGAGRFIVIPYPFVAARMHASTTARRSPRMIFAGAINAKVYPEREQLFNELRHQPWLRLLVRHLEHPGYPEVGDPVLHRHIGDQFVALLAQYRFMFMSGSRCALEFLKYRECAYAGCVPVGLAPATFEPALRDCILPLDPRDPWPALWRNLRLPAAEVGERAARFATLQQEARNPTVLNRQLDSFLRPHLARVQGEAGPR